MKSWQHCRGPPFLKIDRRHWGPRRCKRSASRSEKGRTAAVHKNNSVSGRLAVWLKKVRLETFLFNFCKKKIFFSKNGQKWSKIAAAQLASIVATRCTGNRIFFMDSLMKGPLTPGATSACGRDCSRRRRSTTSGVTVTARPPRPTNAVCRRQRPDTESPVFSASSWSPFVSVGLLLDVKLTGRSREVTASVAM